MSNHIRNNLYSHQGKYKVYDDLPRRYVMPLICDTDDKYFYRQYSFFNKCFNCEHFCSLTADFDYCSLTGFIANFYDLPCNDFKPIKLSWFYRDFCTDDVHFRKQKKRGV